MTQIVGPDGKPRHPMKKGHDLATLDQVFNICFNIVGPMAMLLEEVKLRQMALEDHLGYTYRGPTAPVDVTHPELPPDGTES